MKLPRNLWILLILGASHLYIGLRIVPSMAGSRLIWLSSISLLVLSYGLMTLSLAARSFWPRPFADRMATPGYFMAGLFSSLLVLTLVRDVLLVPVHLLVPRTCQRRSKSGPACVVNAEVKVTHPCIAVVRAFDV